MPRSTEIVGEKTNSTGLIIHRIIAYVVLVLLVVVSLFPFYLLIINATRGRSQAGIRWYPDHFLATNFKNLFSGSTAVAYGSVWRSLANSLFISACASLLSVYFSALTAYATHVYQFKLRKFADMFILIVMMVPTQASAIGFYQFMNKLGWTDTYIPLIIPAVAAPATYYFMKQYMASALPLEIVEAARIDGCGEFKTFNKIVTPILKPAFAVQIIFTFVTNWNNYFMPRLILTSKSKYTIPLVLNAMRYALTTGEGRGNVQLVHRTCYPPCSNCLPLSFKVHHSWCCSGKRKGLIRSFKQRTVFLYAVFFALFIPYFSFLFT